MSSKDRIWICALWTENLQIALFNFATSMVGSSMHSSADVMTYDLVPSLKDSVHIIRNYEKSSWESRKQCPNIHKAMEMGGQYPGKIWHKTELYDLILGFGTKRASTDLKYERDW